MATTGTKKTTATENTPKTPEQLMRSRAAREIGRGVWAVGYNAENPKSTREERTKAWKLVRKDFTKIGRKALKTLEKSGFEVTQKAAS